MNLRDLDAYFEFLDDLRDSGVTNMWGARPYLMRKYPKLKNDLAGKITSAWMKTFDPKKTSLQRAGEILASFQTGVKP